MPELNFTGHLETDVFLLQARMIYPGDETRIMRDVAMRMTRAAEDAGKVCELDVVLTSPLWDAGPREKLEEDAVKQTKSAENAGFIVYDIRRRFDQGDETASKKQAVRDRSAFLKDVDSMHPDGSDPNDSETHVKSKFKEFESVAHFWAAIYCFDHGFVAGCKHIASGSKAMLAELPLFLAVAEDYRLFGESWSNTRQDQGRSFPLLDPSVTWKVPRNDCPYALPDVKLIYETSDIAPPA